MIIPEKITMYLMKNESTGFQVFHWKKSLVIIKYPQAGFNLTLGHYKNNVPAQLSSCKHKGITTFLQVVSLHAEVKPVWYLFTK